MASSRKVFMAIATCLMVTKAFAQINPCISDCIGRPSGDYQSCNGCNIYATCSHGYLYDNRPCPATLVWDDSLKRCDTTSTTCPWCVRSCLGVPIGDYQSCNGCNVYVTCVHGAIHDNRPCPPGLVFDNNSKRCDHTSTTCA